MLVELPNGVWIEATEVSSLFWWVGPSIKVQMKNGSEFTVEYEDDLEAHERGEDGSYRGRKLMKEIATAINNALKGTSNV